MSKLLDVLRRIDDQLVDSLAGLSRRTASELRARNASRPRTDGRWLTPEESRTLAVLASLIVPSEAGSPGAKEADAVRKIDALIAESPKRQEIYGRGLLALDRWARRTYCAGFTELTHERQMNCLKRLDLLQRQWLGSDAPDNKVKSMLLMRYFKITGFFSAVALFPWLRQDTLKVFYTSRVAWEWLGYDGPPMPRGYIDLLESRSVEANHSNARSIADAADRRLVIAAK